MSAELFLEALHEGATMQAATASSQVSPALASVIVDDMKRRGMLQDATSLCASGLGLCHGGKSPEALLSCAGCPLVLR